MSMEKLSFGLSEDNSIDDLFINSSLLGIVILLVLLNLIMILQDFYSSFQVSVQFFLNTLYYSWKFLGACSFPSIHAKTKKPARNVISDRKLSLQEVKTLIDELAVADTDHQVLGKLGSREIASLVDEDPNLEEAREAFALFDDNNDGFIDAGELSKALCTLIGFAEISELECRKMIRTFDKNRDGMIDFQEFVKILECSFG